MKIYPLPSVILKEARGWLADIGYPGASRLTDNQTRVLIARLYDGGLVAFGRDTAALLEGGIR